MPDKKPWEQYSSNEQSQSVKPWEKYSPSSKKKESSVLDLIPEGVMSSSASVEPKKEKVGGSGSSTTKQQKTFDESFELKQEEKKPSGKPDGIYSYSSNPNALYKKDQGKWYIDIGKNGNFKPLTSGDVQKRVSQLEKNSERYFDAEYEQNANLKFEAAPMQKPSKKPLSFEQEEAQTAFNEDFVVFNKAGLTSEEQKNYAADFKARRDLGDSANPEELAKRTQYYKVVDKQKILKQKGYDIDVNGDINDPKTVKALKLQGAKVEAHQKAKEKTSKFINDVDTFVDLELMGDSEEKVVAFLNKRFGASGFIFDETGIGDAITVSYSPDGYGMIESEPITIDLQSFFSDESELKRLKGYMKQKYVPEDRRKILNAEDYGKLDDEGASTEEKEAAERLYYRDVVSLMASDPARYGKELIEEGQFDNFMAKTARNLNASKKNLEQEYADLDKKIKAFNENPTIGGDVALNKEIEKLKEKERALRLMILDAKNTEENYVKAVGSYAKSEEKKGTFLGGLSSSFFKELASLPRMGANIAADVLPTILGKDAVDPVKYGEMKREGLTDEQIANKLSSQIKRTILSDVDKAVIDIASFGTTTDEYLKSEDRGFFQKSVNALAGSIGASVAGRGNKTLQTLAFFCQSYNNMENELSGKEFDDMSMFEKKALSVGYGMAIGYLEKLGLKTSSGISRNLAVKRVVNNALSRTFTNLPKDASIHAIEESLGNNIKAVILDSGFKIVGGALVEGGTESAQTLFDVSLKNVVNAMHDKEYFQNVPDLSTKEGIKEALLMAAEDGAMGAVGGAIMGSVDTYVTNRNTKSADSDFALMYESLNDPNLRKSLKMNVAFKLENGQITKEQAISEVRNIDLMTAKVDKIPVEYSNREKRVAFELLNEKEFLENKIKGKDPILASKEVNRIKEIDNELLEISRSHQESEMQNNKSIQEDSDYESAKFGIKKTQDNTAQGQETNESVLRTERPEFAQGDVKQESISEEVVSEPTIASFTDVNGNSIQGELDVDTQVLSMDSLEGVSAFTEITGQEFDPNTFKDEYQNNIDQFIDSGYGAVSFTNELGETETIALTQDVINPVEQQEIEFEDVKSIDVTDKTNLQKVQSYLDGLIGDLDKFGGETLGMNLPVALAKTVLKTVKTLVDAGVTLENAVKQAAIKHNVADKDITDTISTIRNQAKNQALKQAEAISKPKKVSDASKAAKQIGKKAKKMIVIDEAKELVNQIKLEARAARDKKKQVKEVLTTISDSAKAMQTKGKITVRQMNALLSGMKRLNMDNEIAVNRYINYVNKVISDAEYVQKQSEASSLRKSIKRLSKGKKGGKFVSVSRGFGELNPKWVEDIDKYLEIAATVKKSLTPTKFIKGEAKFKEEASVKEIAAYTSQEQDRQNEVVAENIRLKYESITGDNGKGKSVGEMKAEMLSTDFSEKEDYTDRIKEALSEKLEDLKDEVAEDAIPEIKEAVNIDLNIVDNKTAMRIIDAIDSYIANGSIAGIKAQMAAYRGLKNIKDSNLKTSKLRLAGSRKLGQFQSEQFTNINVVTERIFGGALSAAKFRRESGLQDSINGSNKAEKQAVSKQNEYVKKFSKIKNFDSVDNIYERNVIAFLRRNLVDGDQIAEFERRKSLLKQSLEKLKKGSDAEKRKAEPYGRVLGNLGVLDENSTLQSIEKKAKSFNKEAVDFITEMWNEKYFDLADLAEGVYNTQLSRDVNYTPDRFKKLDNSVEMDQVVDGSTFGFGAFNNIVLDKNEAGVLIETKRPSKLPAGRYVDLDFDSNVFRSYRLALNDLYTAESIRQLSAYLDSEKFNSLIDTDDANILKGMISNYISAKKGKNFTDRDTTEMFNKFMNYMGALGAGRALVALSQPILQFSTASVNTIAQAGINWQPQDLANKDAMAFVDNSGYAIANRGLEAATTIEKADESIQFESPAYKVVSYLPKKLADANAFMLKLTLSKPDIAAARLAWLAYYRKKAKEIGVDVDFTKEPNKEAGDYAQAMVDRNVDVSDTELRGKFFKDSRATSLFIKQVFFPFATFALNQKNRMWNDMRVGFSPEPFSKEDRKAARRSLLALGAEMTIYNGLRLYIGKLMLEAALSLLDIEDDEKEDLRKKYDNSFSQNVATKAFQDLVSPSPIADNSFLYAANYLMDKTNSFGGDQKEFDKLVEEENKRRYEQYQEPLTEDQIDAMRLRFDKENQFRFFIDDEKDFGTLSIQYGKAVETYEMFKAMTTGEFTQETQYGDAEKKLTKEGQDQLLLPLGLKIGAALIAPREADQIANRMYKVIKNNYGVTENQYDKIEELKKMGADVNSDAMKLIKSKKGNRMLIENMYDEIQYINSLSGKEKDEYLKSIGINE